MLGGLLAAGCPTVTRASPDPEASSMKYEEAIALLDSPDTWCQGAKKLVKLGDRDAVLPLLRAYESRAEADKLCLLDAMEELGASSFAHELFEAPGAEDRRMAAHLMELLFDDSHLPYLERAAVDDDDKVRRQGLRSIATQRQTPAWEATMIRLLDAERVDTRGQAITSLARRNTDTAREALRRRAGVETDPELRERLTEAIATE
jgi:hypothetical protein